MALFVALVALGLSLFGFYFTQSCNVTGSWSGYTPPATYDDSQAYYVAVRSASSSMVEFQVVPTLSGNSWSSVLGFIDLSKNEITAYVDGYMSSPNSVQIAGKMNLTSCNEMYFDSNTVIPTNWIRTQKIDFVHVVQMSHLDIGYDGISPTVGYINNVLNVYFQSHLPRSIYISNAMRALGYGDKRYIYTQHPWLLSLYLDCPQNFTLNGVTLLCPTEDQVAQMKEAILRGDVTWHASPFNVQYEAMESSLFDGALNMADVLDQQFGFNDKTEKVVSNRDVPGITRSAIPILVKHNIKAVSVGENPASAPIYDKVFLWRDNDTNSEVIGLWHAHGYGGISRFADCVTVSYSTHALCVNVRTDNSGSPDSVEEVLDDYAQIEMEFPGAVVRSSTFDAFVKEIWDGRDALPVVTQEIGDIWIQGINSDLLKFQVYRLFARMRKYCFEKNNCSLNDTRIRNFDRFLLKMPEHTWGLPDALDNIHWSNAQFHPVRTTYSGFVNCANAWYEQRQFADYALAALQDHPLANDIRAALPDLVVSDLPNLSKYNKLSKMTDTLTCGNFEIGFDGITGNIVTFIHNNTIGYASVDSPLTQIIYTSYDESDFDYMMQWYGGNAGYSKPGSQNATIRQHWYPDMKSLHFRNDSKCSIVSHLSFKDSKAHTLIGAPSDIYINITLDPDSNDRLFVEYLQYNKTVTRLPESMMFGFSPMDEQSSKNGGNGLPTFYVEKMDNLIKFSEVEMNGTQYQHGIWEYVKSSMYGNNGDFYIRSLDVGLVSPITTQSEYNGWFGTPTCFPVPLYPLSTGMTDIKGFAFNLFNNIWNTNYALWYPFMDSWPLLQSNDAHAKFRFEISVA